MSTDSGIPDFRSPGGVWTKYQPVYFDEFLDSADARREYWRQKCESHADFAAAEPNQGHEILAEWEMNGRLKALITQNIDGLHQIAGSKNVLELHGTAREVGCLSCEFRDDVTKYVERFKQDGDPSACPRCGGLLKHATISFGQQLPLDVIEAAAAFCQSADLIVALGTSLAVSPAADLPRLAVESGGKLVIINRTETPLDSIASVVLKSGISETLAAINASLRAN